MSEDNHFPPNASFKVPDFTPPNIRPDFTSNLHVPLSELPAGKYCLVFKVEHGEITRFTADRLDRLDDQGE